MNTEDFNLSSAESDLDALFANARSSQPELLDDNFTKVVLNSLLPRSSPQHSVKLRKSFSFDLVGALIGLLCAYLFVDQTAVMSSLLALVPESLVISPIHIIGGASAFMLTSVVAWWTYENVRL